MGGRLIHEVDLYTSKYGNDVSTFQTNKAWPQVVCLVVWPLDNSEAGVNLV